MHLHKTALTLHSTTHLAPISSHSTNRLSDFGGYYSSLHTEVTSKVLLRRKTRKTTPSLFEHYLYTPSC